MTAPQIHDRDIGVPEWNMPFPSLAWHRFISHELRDLWPTFSMMQKRAIAENAYRITLDPRNLGAT